jgi:uncharacterized protein YecE (DUF72 family)
VITLGLTGWSDHPLIIQHSSQKLEDYSGHFPFVELDSSFYAIPPERNILSWLDKTPDIFQFIPKAYAAMTQHKDWVPDYPSVEKMFDIYKQTFNPMVARGKVKAFLFQFPPYFDCTKENVSYLRKVRQLMGNLPVAIEFRHQSWMSENYRSKTLQFLKDHHFIIVVTDQPQTPSNSIPTVLEGTHPSLTLYRLHGRNYEGWLGEDVKDWRAERTLHDYSKIELEEIKENTLILEKQSNEVAVIFNNNSGGHAAKNAKELQEMLGIDFEGLAPRQLGLF